jgi:hypothetical protein
LLAEFYLLIFEIKELNHTLKIRTIKFFRSEKDSEFLFEYFLERLHLLQRVEYVKCISDAECELLPCVELDLHQQSIIRVTGTEIERLYDLLLVFVSNFIHFFGDSVDIVQINIFSLFDKESDLLCESKNVFDKIDDVL